MSERIGFERTHLLGALNAVARVKPWQRDVKDPALIRIAVAGGLAAITSTNFEATITAVVQCGPGDATMYLPLASTIGAVEKAPKGSEIVLAPNGADTVLSAGRFRSRVSGCVEQFGPERVVPTEDAISIDVTTLKSGLRVAAPATSDDAKQPFLGGVYLHDTGNGVSLVAQDGNRIHAAAGNGDHLPTPAILPDFLADLLLATLPDEGKVAVALGKRTVSMSFGAFHVTSTLIEGQFPTYAQKLAVGTDRALRVDSAAELLSDIDLVCTVADRTNFDFRLDLGAKCEASAFRRVGNGHQAGAVVLNAEFAGAPLAIGFQVRLVADALALFGADPIEWRMSGPQDPTIITSPNRPGVQAMVSPFMLVAEHRREAA